MSCKVSSPMFNIPETFSKAISYEGQINVIFKLLKDIADDIKNLDKRITVLENENV